MVNFPSRILNSEIELWSNDVPKVFKKSKIFVTFIKTVYLYFKQHPKFENIFSLFSYYLSLKKGVTPFFRKFEAPSAKIASCC